MLNKLKATDIVSKRVSSQNEHTAGSFNELSCNVQWSLTWDNKLKDWCSVYLCRHVKARVHVLRPGAVSQPEQENPPPCPDPEGASHKHPLRRWCSFMFFAGTNMSKSRHLFKEQKSCDKQEDCQMERRIPWRLNRDHSLLIQQH